MIPSIKGYVPTLAIRPSEMSALEYLPGATKDRIMPCILFAPWLSSNSLDKAMDRVHKAFPRRYYFLDINQDYRSNSKNNARQEFAQLKDYNDSFLNWVKFVEQYEWVLPCLQSKGQSEAELRRQIEAFQKLNRAYCVRIVQDRSPDNIEEIISALAADGLANFAIILEGGWVKDALSLSAWFGGLTNGIRKKINAQVPIVLSCTSMPKMFSAFNGVIPVEFNNRKLVDQIRRQSNRPEDVIYGDWGSTRPRNNSGGGGDLPPARIDYPTADTWYISRNKNDSWNFKTAAEKLMAEDIWDGNLGIWGEEMIYRTTISKDIGISSLQKNVAARVNIHLHRQAFYGESSGNPQQFDDDWED